MKRIIWDPDEIRALMAAEKPPVTGVELASMLRLHPATVSRWLCKHCTPPPLMQETVYKLLTGK